MSKPGLPEDVCRFIIENISSIGQLEVLLLLYLNKEKSWTSEAIGEEMTSSGVAGDKHLNDLYSRGFVSKKIELGKEVFSFCTVSREQEKCLDQLAKYYNDYRVSIITLIYEKPTDALRSFSAAFKIKKEKFCTPKRVTASDLLHSTFGFYFDHVSNR